MDAEIIVIGAGAAGLAAMVELDRANVSAICLEARDRIGGRIHTIRPFAAGIPIELGAEFVHGRSPEIWEVADRHKAVIYDCHEHSVYMKDGRLQTSQEAWLLIDQVMTDLHKAAESGPDIPFTEFLATVDHPKRAKDMALSFVQGFNAARPDEIGIQSLAQDAKAAESIDGDKSFRIANGYESIPQLLANELRPGSSAIRTGSIVEAILWRQGSASVHVRSAITGQQRKMDARAVIVTLPLGVLQARDGGTGTIHFDPVPERILASAARLRFGQVVRVVFLFRERIWEEKQETSNAGFILPGDPSLPAWWTPLPVRAPILTGWCAAGNAEALLGQACERIALGMIERFSRATGIATARLQNSLVTAFYHDWHADPFSRGAYSYTPAGALEARSALAEPVGNTLFFAGEATETQGHSATVHGAIATGRRAAAQVLASLR